LTPHRQNRYVVPQSIDNGLANRFKPKVCEIIARRAFRPFYELYNLQ
jgi:hypothetical protein